MQASPDDRQIVAEVQAAMAIVRRHRPAAIIFRVSCDRWGFVKLVLERMEGVPLAALSDEMLTDGVESET